ncbi:type II secretion system protein [Methylobacterium terricola]|uniref:Type II secretion system protein n=1 Tax=Methylobacterium terricola TaxID=2583531 RepID=A0A5C4LM44_9HYPH|nr:type II secretion system protein [Methylobacterium terricola]TNC15851.1 type II secretion system protein [Methylobacterium terricola]
MIARLRRLLPYRPHPSDEDGFTTVEVLVAFGIAAAATVMAFQIAGTAAGAVRRIEASRVAADEAEGVVLRRLADGPLRPGLLQGTFSDGTPWTLSIADLRPVLGLGRVPPPLWQVRVSRGGTDAPLYATLIPGRPE